MADDRFTADGDAVTDQAPDGRSDVEVTTADGRKWVVVPVHSIGERVEVKIPTDAPVTCLPTASAIDRAIACPGSQVLPHRSYHSEDSAWGTVVHRYLDRAHAVGREAALEEIADAGHRERCAAIDLAGIPAGASSEVALAYDLDRDTATLVDLDGPRQYPDDGRIYGTADRAGIRDGKVYVGDFKSGTAKVAARNSMQLRFLALAAARWTGLDEAIAEMLYLRQTGTWYPDRVYFCSMDLDATRGELLALRRNIIEAKRAVDAGGLPQLVPGLHCEYCPAAVECPAQERQQRALVATAPRDLVGWIAAMPAVDAGALAERAIVVAKLAERVREAADARVLATGEALPLPSGRRLERVQHNAQKQSETAKRRLADLRAVLRDEGEITTEPTWQIRVVGQERT